LTFSDFIQIIIQLSKKVEKFANLTAYFFHQKRF